MASDVPHPSHDDAIASSEADEPFSRRASLTAIKGLLIAVVSFSAPLVAVITDPNLPFSATDPHRLGSAWISISSPVTFARLGESHR